VALAVLWRLRSPPETAPPRQLWRLAGGSLGWLLLLLLLLLLQWCRRATPARLRIRLAATIVRAATLRFSFAAALQLLQLRQDRSKLRLERRLTGAQL
jgi:hypothetical protein